MFGFVVYAAFSDVNTYSGLRNKPFLNIQKTLFSDNQEANGAKGPFFIDVNQNTDIFYPHPPCQLLSYYPLNNSNCLSTFGDPPSPLLG